MARKAHHGFNMNIIYDKPSSADEYVVDDLNATYCRSIEELLTQADYVSLHCPGNVQTRHLMNAERLNLMKPTAHLIYTARGDVVDTFALIDSLKNKSLAGAGLDVYENEPNVYPMSY